MYGGHPIAKPRLFYFCKNRSYKAAERTEWLMRPFRSARVKRLSRHKQRRRCYSTVLLTRLYPCVCRLCRSRGAEVSYRCIVTGIRSYARIPLRYFLQSIGYLRGAAPHPGLLRELTGQILEFHQCRGQNDLITRDLFEAKTF